MMQTKRKAAVPEVVPVVAKARARLSMTGLKLWSTNIRTVLLNLVFLIIVIVLVPLLIGQFQRNQVIIEPIAVPDVLAKRGLTAEVVANRLWDGLSDVKIAANTAKETVASLPDSRRVEFSFPDSGVSIESLIFHIRRLFNAYETRVAGEFVCGDTDCSPAQLRLRLRVIRDRVDIIDLPPMADEAERAYFSDAAVGILGILDPFVAIAATSKAQPLKATILARRLVSAKHKDAKWAYNLIGLIRLNAGDTADALQEFQAALALDAGFVPARINLGNTLFTTGDLDGARNAYQAVRDREPRNVLAAEGFAELMLAAGDSAGAVRAYLDAAEMDPTNPRYATKAGRIEIAAGHTDAGVTLFTQALALDPSYLPAFAELGAVYLGSANYVAAEKIYRDAADYAPDDAEAQADHALVLAILHDWAGAALRYDRASILAPDNASYQREHAVMLQHLGRHAEALTQLEAVANLTPEDPAVYMAMADSYRDTDHKPQAVAAYRKFLEVTKPDDMMRPVAQRFIVLLSQ